MLVFQDQKANKPGIWAGSTLRIQSEKYCKCGIINLKTSIAIPEHSVEYRHESRQLRHSNNFSIVCPNHFTSHVHVHAHAHVHVHTCTHTYTHKERRPLWEKKGTAAI